MSNSILYLDVNSLIYAWKAGDAELLYVYKASAEAAGFKIAVTDVVVTEVARGPLQLELGKWLTEQGIAEQKTAEGARYRTYHDAVATGQPTGDYNPKNAGERSISEAAGKAKSAGLDAKVFSDDKWFSNKQLLKPYGLTPEVGLNNADMLNQSAVSGKVSPENFERFKTGFRSQPPYDALGSSYSQRLDRFLSAKELSSVLDGGTVSKAILPKLGHGLKVLGLAALIYDVGTSSAEAAEAAKTGNTDKASNIMLRLAARLYFGWEAGLAGAALGGAIGAPGGVTAAAGAIVGGIIGGVIGGVIGAVAGEAAVNEIWGLAGKATSILLGNNRSRETAAHSQIVLPPNYTIEGAFYQQLIAGGISSKQAQHITSAMETEYRQRAFGGGLITDLIKENIGNVQANQAVPEVDDDGAITTHICGPQTETTTIIDADGKVKKSELNADRTRIDTRLDERGRLVEQVNFGPTGTTIVRYEPETGHKILNVSYDMLDRLTLLEMDESGEYRKFVPTYADNGFVSKIISTSADGTQTVFSLTNLNQIWLDFVIPLNLFGATVVAKNIESIVLAVVAGVFPLGFYNDHGRYRGAVSDYVAVTSIETDALLLSILNDRIALGLSAYRATLKFDPVSGMPQERRDYLHTGELDSESPRVCRRLQLPSRMEP